MGCFNPQFIKRPQGIEMVPCGRCIACAERSRAQWTFRLKQELKASTEAYFGTLTYNNEHLPVHYKLKYNGQEKPSVRKTDLVNYFKRVRNEEKNLKYYAVAEYGPGSSRPHYHFIAFNARPDTLVNKWSKRVGKNIEDIGFVKLGTVTDASIHYVTGYVHSKYADYDKKTGTKKTWSLETIRPFSIMSKGLGKIYLKHNEKLHKDNFSTTTNIEGNYVELPRYYRKKLFEDNDKELKKLKASIINRNKFLTLEKSKQELIKAKMEKEVKINQLIRSNNGKNL